MALGAEHTISGATLGHALVADSATTAKFQAVDHEKILNKGDYTHASIDTHINDATKHRVIADGSVSTTTLYSSTKIESLITNINNLISGALVFIGAYNASTNTPNLTSPIAGSVKAGYTYVVSVGGLFFPSGELLQVGDMIIARQADPSTLAH